MIICYENCTPAQVNRERVMTIRVRDSLLRVRVFSDIWCVDAFDAGFEIRNRQSDKPNHPRTIIPTQGGPSQAPLFNLGCPRLHMKNMMLSRCSHRWQNTLSSSRLDPMAFDDSPVLIFVHQTKPARFTLALTWSHVSTFDLGENHSKQVE